MPPSARYYVSHQQKLFGALCTDQGSAYWSLAYEVARGCCSTDTVAAVALRLWQVAESNWSSQPYQIVRGTRITLLNITFVSTGQPSPPAAWVNTGRGAEGAGGLCSWVQREAVLQVKELTLRQRPLTWKAGPKQRV
jgi:hypothetical protein